MSSKVDVDRQLAEIICPELLDTLTPEECHVMHPEIPKIKEIIAQHSTRARLEELGRALDSLRLYTARKHTHEPGGQPPTTYLKDRIKELKEQS